MKRALLVCLTVLSLVALTASSALAIRPIGLTAQSATADR